MSTTLESYLENTIVPAKASIHDSVDTGTLQTLAVGVRTLFTCDGATRNYISGVALWNSTTNTVKDTIQDSKIDITVGFTWNTSVPNNRIKIEIEIDSTIPIPMKSRTILLTRAGVDVDDFIVFPVYNGAEALVDGFKIYLTAQVNDLSISHKSILIRV